MKLLYKAVKNLPEEKKSAEAKAMIDTYNQKVSFIDFSSLNNIINEINHQHIYHINKKIILNLTE